MTTTSTIPEPAPRVARFEKLAYGLFMHWGLYSQLGRGEWIQNLEKIPVPEYAKLIDTFTAADFDARAVARLAREAGMRYMTLTTRHHEGFSLYDTRGLSDFDAPHSPARRDLVAEFVEGCRAEGILPVFYHTTLDWRWDSANCSESVFNEYLDYLNASVEVLCRNYGPIGGLWFDGNWSRKADWKEDRLYATIRCYQPEAMIINNTGLDERGRIGNPELDSTTFEQGLPTAPDRAGLSKYLAGEMCLTMNAHWGLGARDFKYLSPADVIRNLGFCRKVGANFLLNVGPTAQGAIPEYETALLRRVGEWTRLAGNVLYDGKPVPASHCTGDDFLLAMDGRLYYFAYDLSVVGDAHVTVGTLGAGPRAMSGVPGTIASVRWMDTDEELKFTQDGPLAAIDCTGYPYGTNMVVRVAEILLS